MNTNTPYFKRSMLAITVLSALSATSAFAQENAAQANSEDDGVERIMITASKRLKGLQESPVAVTVVNGNTIDQTKVLDINDLQTLVPTLRVTPLQRSTNTNFSIRGFGNGINNTGIEPSVGVFIDGVYRSRAAAQIVDLPRVQQIEVLSGPQSTLFGKNASAGVISVRTLAPSYDFESKVELGIGNFNQRLVKGYVTNGVTDNLALSFSGGFNQRDGYTDNIVGDFDELNNRDRWHVRGQALYEPNDVVTMRFIADFSKIDELCCSVESVVVGPTAGVVNLLGGKVVPQAEFNDLAYQSAVNEDQENHVEDGGMSLQVDFDMDTYNITSITSYRRNDSDYINDVDYNSLDIIVESCHTEIKTYTQEFRIASTKEQALEWMVGAYLFKEDLVTGDTLFYGDDLRPFFDVLVGPGALAGIEALHGQATGTYFSGNAYVNTEFEQDNTAYSLFANFDYHITDDLTAILGVSYTKDEKTLDIKQTNLDKYSSTDFNIDPTIYGVPLAQVVDAQTLAGLQSLQFLPPMLELPNAAESNETNDSKMTWSMRLAYEVNDNLNIFASAATGFKASSWNLSRYASPFAADRAAIEAAGVRQKNQAYGGRYASPEESTVYELGLKSRFDQGAFNVTFFDQTIKGFQSSIFIGTGFVLANAGKQSTKGIEFDSFYNLTDSWTVTLAGTFLDPVYDSFVGASGLNGPTDLSGKKPAGIHEKSVSAGLIYSMEFDNGSDGYVRADYLYESDVHLAENVPDFLRGQSNTLNASAGLTFENGVEVQLWIRNLTEDKHYLSAFPIPIQAGSFGAYPNQPRTYGATVSFSF